MLFNLASRVPDLIITGLRKPREDLRIRTLEFIIVW